MSDEADEEPGGLFDGIEDARGISSNEEGDSEPLVTPEDRPRGILSPTDRDYLCGLKEYAQPQTDANRRQDIRERVKNGLQDFTLLWMLLERDEREKVFEELGEDGTDEAIESMLTFAYFGIDQDKPRMQERIKRGILVAENRDTAFRSAGRATDVNVSIDVEYNPDAEKLYQHFEDGRELSDAEVGVLVRAGKLESDDIKQLQDSKMDFSGIYRGGSGGI